MVDHRAVVKALPHVQASRRWTQLMYLSQAFSTETVPGPKRNIHVERSSRILVEVILQYLGDLHSSIK